MSANRRRSYGRRRSGKGRRRTRRTYRSNRRGAFRRNGDLSATLMGALKVGGLALAGLAAHRVGARLLNDLVLSKVIGTPAVAPPAVSGLEALQPYKGLIASTATAALGILATVKFVKDPETKKYIIGGMAGSYLLGLLVNVLGKFGGAPGAQVVSYLSGYEAGTAESLGASIMPHYMPVGEYFTDPVAGLGEYFESGVSGLGNYGGNPDIYQAAAGLGTAAYGNSMHIDPSSDLDRELTIAEAAAGVGEMPFEAAAGLGEFLGGGGRALPAASTWIPGTSRPDVWAPVTAVSRPQAATAMTPAGVLQTGGGQGVFG